uniref:Uncharacterized protein n=2 Tax=Ascarididae TaxID=6250 RepID=A0A914REQ7_PAREQ
MVMQLSRFDMGMLSSKDGGVDAAVRALRLNHLENLREVQTEINEAIVAVQELTADPKTDKRLGKVGF